LFNISFDGINYDGSTYIKGENTVEGAFLEAFVK